MLALVQMTRPKQEMMAVLMSQVIVMLVMLLAMVAIILAMTRVRSDAVASNSRKNTEAVEDVASRCSRCYCIQGAGRSKDCWTAPQTSAACIQDSVMTCYYVDQISATEL